MKRNCILELPPSFVHVLLIIVFILGSCCNEEDSHYWFPDEAIRYYNTNDSIIFYSPELESIAEYIVCSIDTGHSIFDYGDFCGRQDHYYPIRYDIHLDSCENERFFRINISPDSLVIVIFNYDKDRHDYFNFDYRILTKSQVEINDVIYEDVIEYNDPKSDRVRSFLFSLSHGILQYQSDSLTFSLVHDDI